MCRRASRTTSSTATGRGRSSGTDGGQRASRAEIRSRRLSARCHPRRRSPSGCASAGGRATRGLARATFAARGRLAAGLASTSRRPIAASGSSGARAPTAASPPRPSSDGKLSDAGGADARGKGRAVWPIGDQRPPFKQLAPVAAVLPQATTGPVSRLARFRLPVRASTCGQFATRRVANLRGYTSCSIALVGPF